MELHQVQAFEAQASQRPLYDARHVPPGQGRERVQVGHVLGVDLHLGQGVTVAAQKLADEFLYPGVNIGAIKSRYSGLDVQAHVFQRPLVRDAPVTASKLPASLDHTRDVVYR
jgi:hypothetical protein